VTDVATVSLSGQQVVGTRVTTPWLPGTWEITQGWGVTDYGGEPEGHGYAHWHAGADVGVDCGTLLSMPAGLSGTARTMDNPGGYGTALVVELDSGIDVVLGHLRQRLVANGQQLRPGDSLAITNNTGNSTGCHLHFEVRPHGGRYGTDVDPTALLLSGTSAATGVIPDAQLLASSGPAANPYGPLDPRSIAWELQHGLQAGLNAAVDTGQIALGSVMLLAGLVVTGYGLRGRDAAALARDTRRVVTRRRAQPQRRRPAPQVTGAERTRVRLNLQRGLPPAQPARGPGPTPSGPARRAGLPRARQLALPPGRP